MRSATGVTRVICGGAFLWTLGWATPAHAQLAVGEWARTDAAGGGMTMTVAACCSGGYRLTYRVPIANGWDRGADDERRQADWPDDVRQTA